MKLYQRFSLGEFGAGVVAYSLLACSVIAFVLIPIGIIQTLGAIIKHLKEKRL